MTTIWPILLFLALVAAFVSFVLALLWRDHRAARRVEDERVTTGIDVLKAIPPAEDLARPLYVAPSPLLGSRRRLQPPVARVFWPVTPWSAPTGGLLLVAPTTERRRELVNA